MGLNLEGFNQLAGVDTDPDETIIEQLRFDDALEIPHQLTDIDMWKNYTDDRLYELDKEVRAYINKSKYNVRRSKGHMKTAVPLVFMYIFGRAAGSEDSQICVILHRLLRYYCSKVTGSTTLDKQRYTRVYYFSKYAMYDKRPYSIRLRLEENANATLRATPRKKK